MLASPSGTVAVLIPLGDPGFDVRIQIDVSDVEIDEPVFAGTDVEARATGGPEGLIEVDVRTGGKTSTPQLFTREICKRGTDADVRPDGAIRVEVPVQAEDRCPEIGLADPQGIVGQSPDLQIEREVGGDEEVDANVLAEHVLDTEREGLALVEHEVAPERAFEVGAVGVELVNAGSHQPIAVLCGSEDG